MHGDVTAGDGGSAAAGRAGFSSLFVQTSQDAVKHRSAMPPSQVVLVSGASRKGESCRACCSNPLSRAQSVLHAHRTCSRLPGNRSADLAGVSLESRQSCACARRRRHFAGPRPACPAALSPAQQKHTAPHSPQITGCSSGLGRALAQRLAAERLGGSPAYVVYASARNRDSLKELEAEGIRIVQLDVTNQARGYGAGGAGRPGQGAGCNQDSGARTARSSPAGGPARLPAGCFPLPYCHSSVSGRSDTAVPRAPCPGLWCAFSPHMPTWPGPPQQPTCPVYALSLARRNRWMQR